MEHVGTILAYQPSGSSHLWTNPRAMIFRWGEDGNKKETAYLSYADHHTAHLFNRSSLEGLAEVTKWVNEGKEQVTELVGATSEQEQLFERVQKASKGLGQAHDCEHEAEHWAVLAKGCQQIPLMALVIGYGFHKFGIELPIIGGPMTATKWGLLSGLALELGPVPFHIGSVPIPIPLPIVAALIHTFVSSGRFIGHQGLFTRGLVTYILSTTALYSVFWRSRSLLAEGWDERLGSRGQFLELWTNLGVELNRELDKAIEGEAIGWSELQQTAQQLIEKEKDLRQIYGGEIDHYKIHVVTAAKRILAFKPTTAIPQEIQDICEGKWDRSSTLKSQKELLEGTVNGLASPSTPEDSFKLATVQQTLKDIDPDIRAQQECDQNIRQLTSELHQALKQVANKIPDLKTTNGPVSYANQVYEIYKTLDNVPAETRKIYVKLDEAIKHYQSYDPRTHVHNGLKGEIEARDEFKEALAIATLCQNEPEEWRYGDETKATRRWDGAKEKLDQVKNGYITAKKFVEWVQERALIERDMVATKAKTLSPHLPAYKAWDTYRRAQYLHNRNYSLAGGRLL